MDEVHGWKQYGWTFFVVVILFAAVLAGGVSWAIVSNGRKIDKAQTALTALCAQRRDLDQRIEGERKLLSAHRGKFIFSIPRSLIVSGYRRDLKTRYNLSILECKE
jgi:outer membrane murein-binding lipoprotein Lpp